MIERDELPIGFTMELAMNPEAMSRFSGLTEPEQKQVVNRARNIMSHGKCATTWKICLRKDDGTWTEYRHPESRIPADRNPWNFQEETAAPMGMETFLK